MATMGTGTRTTANGMSAGSKSLGTVKGRPLGRPGEGAPYIGAYVKAKSSDCLHHQVTCAGGRGMGNKGNGWKINGNEARVSGPPIATYMKAVNYKDPQRAKKHSK